MFARSLILGIVSLYVVPLTVCADDDWQFHLTPYLWFAGLEGDIATISGAPVAPIDLSPSDAIDGTETSLMFLFDVIAEGKVELSGDAEAAEKLFSVFDLFEPTKNYRVPPVEVPH